MNLAHVHLLLNHFPTVGFLVGVGLFGIGLVGRSNDLKRVSLIIFLAIALLSLATYMSGNGAANAICKAEPDQPCPNAAVSGPLIRAHEGAAMVATAFMELTGALAWLGLWQWRRKSQIPGFTLAAVLILSVVTFGLMARASNMGGEILHPEVRTAGEAVAPPLARHLGTWVTENTFVWPTCETLHFIGLCLLFGVAALVDLRMLGGMKHIAFPALHRLLPWGILGFGVNMITGMFFFIADPGSYVNSGTYQWKMALILVAGINVVYFTIFDAPWKVEADKDAPFTAKFVAASALVLVLGVMFCGRMLPFLGDSF